jgi:hypothetical protein
VVNTFCVACGGRSGFRCAYHKTGIIHHGKLYVFPNHLCFTSSSGLTTVLCADRLLMHRTLLLLRRLTCFLQAKVTISEIQSITLKVINAIQIITTLPDQPKGKKVCHMLRSALTLACLVLTLQC